MASAMVFVDDAVLGHLPPVCAKTGAETPDRMVMTVPVGTNEGLGIAWLLVLAGPIGWLGLFLYAMFRREETLTVRLPYSDAAYHDLARARRVRRNAGLATILLPVLALIVLIPQSLSARAAAAALIVVAIGSFSTYIAETFHVRRAGVRVDLDGSRRWVTLSRISDPLAEAIKRQQAIRTPPRMDAARAF